MEENPIYIVEMRIDPSIREDFVEWMQGHNKRIAEGMCHKLIERVYVDYGDTWPSEIFMYQYLDLNTKKSYEENVQPVMKKEFSDKWQKEIKEGKISVSSRMNGFRQKVFYYD